MKIWQKYCSAIKLAWWSNKLPQKIWAQLVQPFSHLLDTNTPTERPAKFIYVDNRKTVQLWNININLIHTINRVIGNKSLLCTLDGIKQNIFLFSASVTVTENDSRKNRLIDGNWATDSYWYTTENEKM